MTIVNEQLLRAAILEVIGEHRYSLYEATTDNPQRAGLTTDFATQERITLAKDVIARYRTMTAEVPGIGRILTKQGLSVLLQDYLIFSDHVCDSIAGGPLGQPMSNRPCTTCGAYAHLDPEVQAKHMHELAQRAWEQVPAFKWDGQPFTTIGAANGDARAKVKAATKAAGWANEATKLASPNAIAFNATTAALTACALLDPKAAAEAHRRAANAYNGFKPGPTALVRALEHLQELELIELEGETNG